MRGDDGPNGHPIIEPRDRVIHEAKLRQHDAGNEAIALALPK